MAKCYQYTADGYYAEEIEDYGLLPNNATYTAPELQEGHIPRWNGKTWEQVENHQGEEGYVDGKSYTIKGYGPYPDGWSDTPPEPTPEERNAQRRAEILARLKEIDAESARPLRAILLDTQNGVEPSGDDLAELAVCEAEVLELRAELAKLEAKTEA